MKNFLKGLFNKITGGLKGLLKFVSRHVPSTFLICIVGLGVISIIPHYMVLTGGALFIMNMLHIVFVLGLVMIVLSKISQLRIFDGEVKVMKTSSPHIVSPS